MYRFGGNEDMYRDKKLKSNKRIEGRYLLEIDLGDKYQNQYWKGENSRGIKRPQSAKPVIGDQEQRRIRLTSLLGKKQMVSARKKSSGYSSPYLDNHNLTFWSPMQSPSNKINKKSSKQKKSMRKSASAKNVLYIVYFYIYLFIAISILIHLCSRHIY